MYRAVLQKSDSDKRPLVMVNEYKENQNIPYVSLRPIPKTVLEKTLKVHLAAFPLSDDDLDQFKQSKSLLEKNSDEVMLCMKTERKTACRGVLSQKMEATSSRAESTLQKSSLDVHLESNPPQYQSASDTVILNIDTESSQDGDSEEDNAVGLDDFPELSPYERKRLKNISENANFFASLQLSESAARLREIIEKRQPSESKRKKPKKRENETGCRRSMRLQRVDPSGIPLPETPTQPELVAERNVEDNSAVKGYAFSGTERTQFQKKVFQQKTFVKLGGPSREPLLPPGPLDMLPENQDDTNESFNEFLHTWTEISKTSSKNVKEFSSLKSYITNLSGMVLSEDTVCKTTKGAVFSIALHPSETRTLVAAGGKFGYIGLWDLTQQPKEDGIYVFQPHSQPVSCLYFSPVNPAHILSLSYDGTLRCGDFSRAIFEEVYRNESKTFSSFDFLTEDASTLVVGHWDGTMSVVDRRTPGTSYEKLTKCSLEKIRTIHVHPVHRQYFVIAGLRDVHIYDARNLARSSIRPLISLTEHTKSVASAYFSPATGNRVVTTCADSHVRIFDSSCMSSQFPLLTAIRHNTNSGRWLTRFRAVWDPKQEDCIIVGSMAYPRRVEIFHETGEHLHSLLHEEYLASVCSINAMHPTRFILAGGNSSGKIYVFMNSETC